MKGNKEVEIGEIAEIRSGFGFPIHLQGKSSGDYPFAKVGDISKAVRSGRLEVGWAEHHVDHEQLKELKAQTFPSGSIVFAKIGEAIKQNFRAITTREMLFDNNVMGIVPDSSLVDGRYLFHFMRQVDLRGYANVTSVPSIRRSDIESIKLPLPPFAEQKRISAILDKADRLHRTCRYAQQLSDTFLQSVFLEMFSEAEYDSLPLEKLALDKRGSFVNGPFGSDLLTTELTTKGVPVVYIRDIRDGVYERVSNVFVTSQKAKELSFCQVTHNDVLVAKVGDPPGMAAIYPRDQPMGIVTQDVIRIKVNTSIITSEYLTCFLNSSKGHATLHPIIIEGTRERFGLTSYKQLYVPVPPLALQKKFSQIYQRFERLRAQQREATRQAEHLFQTLLHRAFRGEL